MIIYIILFVSTILLSIIYNRLENKEKYKKFFFIALFIMIGSVQAFRYNVGTDYKGTYTNIYNILVNSNTNSINLDVGYYFIYKLVINSGVGLSLFFVLTGFLNTFLFLKAIFDNSKNITIGLIIYFLGTAFFFSMNAIRQATSIGLFLISIKYLNDRNAKKYFILNIIGFLFHSSSIIYLPLYFLANKKINMKKAILLLLVVFTTSAFLGGLVNNIMMHSKFYKYFTVDSSEFATGRLNLQAIVNMIILFISYLYYKKLCSNSSYVTYCNIMLCCAAVSLISIYIPAGFRIVSALKYIDILAIPNFIFLLRNSKSLLKNYRLVQMFIIPALFLIYIGYFCYSALYMNYNDCIPYQSIFSIKY